MSLHKFLGLAPPPSKKQKTVEACRDVGSMKPKKERGPSNQIGLTNSHGNWLEHKKKLKLLICSTKN